MAKIIIVAETGCDIPAREARELGIELVPMHVTVGDTTFDDGEITSAEMLDRCRKLSVLPKTAGCTPADFEAVFDRVHADEPDAKMLHLAYSAVTTCSLESSITAAKDRDYVVHLDTKHVTIGQGLVVKKTLQWISEHPEATAEDARDYAEELSGRTRMAFIPGDLAYLKSGGRLSNAAFIGATLLRIKPVIELIDGKLIATKKLHGSMTKAATKLLDIIAKREKFDPSCIWFVRSPGLSEEVQAAVERAAIKLGFVEVKWYETGNVITSHCGPGSLGVAFSVME